jgi:chromosome segregation ATPase
MSRTGDDSVDSASDLESGYNMEGAGGMARRLRILESELRESKARLKSKDQAFARLNGRLLELEAAETERVSALRSELNDLYIRLRQLEAQNDALASDNSVLRTETAALRESLGAAREESTALQAQLESALAAQRTWQERAMELQTALDALEATKLLRWSRPLRAVYGFVRRFG